MFLKKNIDKTLSITGIKNKSKICALGLVIALGLSSCGTNESSSKVQGQNNVQNTIDQQIADEQLADTTSSEEVVTTTTTEEIVTSVTTEETVSQDLSQASNDKEKSGESLDQDTGVQNQSQGDNTSDQTQPTTENWQNLANEISEDDSFLDSNSNGETSSDEGDGQIDIDLTTMSADMVYATVYQMMLDADSYVGKTIKMDGAYYSGLDTNTNIRYYFIIIEDATACCQQGMEFVWEDGSHVFPDEYPEDGTKAEVVGVFETYKDNPEDEMDYVRINNASFKVCDEEGANN
ncbi:MAG: hypothetical protein K6E10_01985 [Eubacterium sp.]|nr:hypothetical protein [Eubacterium sp.]